MSFLPKTAHGCDPWDLISAVHKSIRRGEERLAMSYVMELYAHGTKANTTMILNYLIWVLHEDIGLGSPQTIVAVHLMVNELRELVKDDAKKKNATLMLANVVLLMCRSQKSRLAVEFERVVTWDIEEKGGPPPFPDWVFDCHTAKGKKLGRGIEHFLEEGARLFPTAPPARVHNQYTERAHEIWKATYKKSGGKVPPAVRTEPGVAPVADLFESE